MNANLLSSTVFSELPQDVRTRQRGDLYVMRQSGAVRSGAREGILLGALLVSVNQREDLVQVSRG